MSAIYIYANAVLGTDLNTTDDTFTSRFIFTHVSEYCRWILSYTQSQMKAVHVVVFLKALH